MQQLKALVIVMASIILAGCGQGQAPGAGGPKGGGMGAFAVNVVAVKALKQTVLDKVSVVGSLAANESVVIKSEVDGAVVAIKFDEGQAVSQGQELIILDQEKIQAAYEEAQANWGSAQATFDRMKALVEGGAVSRQEYDQASFKLAGQKSQVDLLKAQLDDTVITAPFAGVAGERKVSLGQVIAKDMILTEIIDASLMKAQFHVPERYLSRLSVGQSIELSVAAYIGEVFKGEVFFIDPKVDEMTRTVLVKAAIPNPESKLKVGMFAKLELVIDQKLDGVVIPETALIPKGADVFVYVVDAESKAQMTKVKVGIRMPGELEILEGVAAGDMVITEGYQKIGPGSLVKVAAPDNQAEGK